MGRPQAQAFSTFYGHEGHGNNQLAALATMESYFVAAIWMLHLQNWPEVSKDTFNQPYPTLDILSLILTGSLMSLSLIYLFWIIYRLPLLGCFFCCQSIHLGCTCVPWSNPAFLRGWVSEKHVFIYHISIYIYILYGAQPATSSIFLWNQASVRRLRQATQLAATTSHQRGQERGGCPGDWMDGGVSPTIIYIYVYTVYRSI